MIRSKEDIEYHYDRNRGWPAVNVKVDLYLQNVKLPICLGGVSEPGSTEITWSYTDKEFTADWVEENVPDDVVWGFFYDACEDGFEQLQEMADELWPDYSPKVWPEGRSGGWAVVEGLPDVDSWDAVMLAKWRRFAKCARLVADGVPEQMMTTIYINNFEGE